jgi:hypothetical protein
MLALACSQEIHLRSSRRGSAKASAGAEKNQLRHVPEIKTNTSSVWSAVFSDFVPDDVGLIEFLLLASNWVSETSALRIKSAAISSGGFHLVRMEDSQ